MKRKSLSNDHDRGLEKANPIPVFKIAIFPGDNKVSRFQIDTWKRNLNNLNVKVVTDYEYEILHLVVGENSDPLQVLSWSKCSAIPPQTFVLTLKWIYQFISTKAKPDEGSYVHSMSSILKNIQVNLHYITRE